MVESTYLKLKGQIGGNVINRLEEVSGGYSFENMGLSRLNVLLVNPANGIELSGDPLRFMRKHIVDNIRIGDLDCAIETAFTLLDRGFGIPMRNFEGLYYLVDSRFFNEEQPTQEGEEEFYRQVFKRNEAQVTMGIADSIKPKVAKRLGLSPSTYGKYIHRKSNPLDFNGLSYDEVRVAYLSGEQLNYITGEDISQTGIHSISFKVKSLPSIVGKNMRVFRKIYAPTQEEIDKITGKRGEKLRAEEIWEFYEEWLDYVLKRNADIFKTVISDKYVPSVLARKRFPRKRDKFNAKELNERFLDTFLIDNSGVAFVTDSTQNFEGLIRRFDGVIPNSQILPHKSESFNGKKRQCYS